MPGRRVLGVLLALAREPALARVALVQLVRTAPARWWARPPFLPLPDPAYLRFRIETHRGTGGRMEVDDVVAYLRWCASMRR